MEAIGITPGSETNGIIVQCHPLLAMRVNERILFHYRTPRTNSINTIDWEHENNNNAYI